MFAARLPAVDTPNPTHGPKGIDLRNERDPRSPSTRPVRISSDPAYLDTIGPLLSAAQAAVGDVPALLDLAKAAGATAPKPGEGRTAYLWEILASVTAVDVAAGRVLEPHLDAAAILAQAGLKPGLHAALNGCRQAGTSRIRTAPMSPAATFQAPGACSRQRPPACGSRPGKRPADGCCTASKPWCSLAARLDHAVLTAHLEGGGRAAFAVDLHAPGVSVADPGWTSRGLREIPSGTVQFEAVPAVPLGGPGWYYERPGFAWGGMGVAACWLGGAVAVGRSFTASLRKAADGGREPDQIALAQLGEIDRTLAALTAYLAADRGEDRLRGAGGQGRLAGSPARPGKRRCRRRTHPDSRKPEPRPRPARL